MTGTHLKSMIVIVWQLPTLANNRKQPLIFILLMGTLSFGHFILN